MSVRPSVPLSVDQMVSAHYLESYLIIYHTALIFHMLIGLCKDMPPTGFEFTWSKIMVTWSHGHFVKQWFPLIVIRTIYHRYLICPMLLGLG